MSLDDLGLIDYKVADKTLLIDGDLVVYRPCCVFNEDTDGDRRQIIRKINQAIDSMMEKAGCNRYIMFVTTKFNFRDDLVDDYKANRKEEERPVNLAWAKRWVVKELNTHYWKKLEADDLLGVHMTKLEDAVLWSLDKDLRQIPGQHLDDASGEVITVTNEGILREDTIVSKETGKKKKKVYFDGTIGFYYQLLVGDSTDHIVGCGRRVEAVRKSGPKAGEKYTKRKGIGSGAAVKALTAAALSAGTRPVLEVALEKVVSLYKKEFGEEWKTMLETQANLLFMVRYQYDQVIKRWTVDGRDEYFDLLTGKIDYDFTPPTD